MSDQFVKGAILYLPVSKSLDVQGYAMYMAESPAVPDRQSPRYDLGNDIRNIDLNSDGNAADYLYCDLATLPDMTTKDGIYNMAFVAYDERGNESDMITSQLLDVPLDFVAPDPPGIPILRES